ncbi:hypothetical protein V6Z11_D08G090300 [Gossypium hirsutum]
MTKVQPWKSTMLTHRRSSAKASSLPTILMTPISTKKKRRIGPRVQLHNTNSTSELHFSFKIKLRFDLF